ncbi:MAG TPA: hypothetical protein VGM88_17820 [Kofleriaceae bacterium]
MVAVAAVVAFWLTRDSHDVVERAALPTLTGPATLPPSARDCGTLASNEPQRLAIARAMAACMADAIAKHQPFRLELAYSGGFSGRTYRVYGGPGLAGYGVSMERTDWTDAIDPRHPDPPRTVSWCTNVTLAVAAAENRAFHGWEETWAKLSCDDAPAAPRAPAPPSSCGVDPNPPIAVPDGARACGAVASTDPDWRAKAQAAGACVADAIAKREPFTVTLCETYLDSAMQLTGIGRNEPRGYQLHEISTAWDAQARVVPPTIEQPCTYLLIWLNGPKRMLTDWTAELSCTPPPLF